MPINNFPLSNTHISNLADAVDQVLTLIGDDVVVHHRHQLLTSLLNEGLDGRFGYDSINRLSRECVQAFDRGDGPVIDSRWQSIVAALEDFLHDTYFAGMHEGGEFHDCESCGASWRRDEHSFLIEHNDDCGYIDACDRRDADDQSITFREVDGQLVRDHDPELDKLLADIEAERGTGSGW